MQIDSLHTQCKLESQFCSAQLSVTSPLYYCFCAATGRLSLLTTQQGLDLVGRKFPTTCPVAPENKTWTTEHRFWASLLTLDLYETIHRNKREEEKTTMPVWPLHRKPITKLLGMLYARCFTARINSKS